MGELTGDRQHPERPDRHEADNVSGDHQMTSLEPVRERSARDHEEHLRQRPRDANQREGAGSVLDLQDLPRDRDEVDPVTDHRDRHAGPEEREVSDRERFEDRDAVAEG